MSEYAFMAMKKLIDHGIIKSASNHNKRAVAAEIEAKGTIDQKRSHLNYVLAGPDTPEEVAQLARDLKTVTGVVRERKNGVRALEFLFSLPSSSSVNHRQYFLSCLDWVASRYGGHRNILSADVHLDEAAPHCHVLLLPLKRGRMLGSEMMGYKSQLAEACQSFHDEVASMHGLQKAPARLAGKSKAQASKKVLDWLSMSSDPSLKSVVWGTIRDAIESDPRPFMTMLGVDIDPPKGKRVRTSVEIFTSPGRGPKFEKPDWPANWTGPHIEGDLVEVSNSPTGDSCSDQLPAEKNTSLCSVGNLQLPPFCPEVGLSNTDASPRKLEVELQCLNGCGDRVDGNPAEHQALGKQHDTTFQDLHRFRSMVLEEVSVPEIASQQCVEMVGMDQHVQTEVRQSTPSLGLKVGALND